MRGRERERERERDRGEREREKEQACCIYVLELLLYSRKLMFYILVSCCFYACYLLFYFCNLWEISYLETSWG